MKTRSWFAIQPSSSSSNSRHRLPETHSRRRRHSLLMKLRQARNANARLLLGRATGSDQRAATASLRSAKRQPPRNSTTFSNRPSRCLQSACIFLVDRALIAYRKDAYGFFLVPVDTSLVQDYMTVITTPMDFGTIKKKVSTQAYDSFDSFKVCWLDFSLDLSSPSPTFTLMSKTDFNLVVDNAMKYNKPDTIYYKEAKKIQQFGHQFFDRYANTELIAPTPKPRESQLADILAPMASTSTDVPTVAVRTRSSTAIAQGKLMKPKTYGPDRAKMWPDDGSLMIEEDIIDPRMVLLPPEMPTIDLGSLEDSADSAMRTLFLYSFRCQH
jgi:hypothetical protein